MGSDPMGQETFIVRFGEELEDADVYVTLRFLRSARHEELTDEKLKEVRQDFLRSVKSAWSDLEPTVYVSLGSTILEESRPGMPSRESYYEEPHVRDVRVESYSGRSDTGVFYVGDITDFTYAHEFGHFLGLVDTYRTIYSRAEDGGIIGKAVPDILTYGPRATESLMGTTKQSKPSPEDIRDILDSATTIYESERDDIYHLDLTGDDISETVNLLRKISEDRGRDISDQLRILESRRDPQKRRRAFAWIMKILFFSV